MKSLKNKFTYTHLTFIRTNTSKSLVDEDPKLNEIYKKLRKVEFEDKYSKELAYSKIPSYADRMTKQNALSEPWSGGYKTSEVALRHQSESKAARKKDLPVLQPFRPRKKVPVSERLTNAREKALDYGLLKDTQDEKFIEMMRDKLLGPEQFTRVTMAATFGSTKSMADSKIEEAKKKGEFDNLPRGKPLDLSYNGNAYLDRTEYHLNNILKKQEVKIPWIEKQGSVRGEIERFRHNLRRSWMDRVVHIIDSNDNSSGHSSRIAKAKHYSENPRSIRDSEWESHQKTVLKGTLRRLNDSIRGYNLQAPMASHIFYLTEEKEIQRCYKEGAKGLKDHMERFLISQNSSSFSVRSSSSSSSAIGSLFKKMFQ